MLKIIKYVLLTICTLLLLLIISAVTLLLVVDPNDYKERITNALHQRTGREVTIGNISWNFFPNAALQLSNVTVNNLPNFGQNPFAHFEEADVHVKLIPLLKGNIEAKKILIKNANLHLIKNKQGKTNWAMTPVLPSSKTIATKPTTNESATTSKNQTTFFNPNKINFSLDEIDFRNATVTWDDEKNKKNTIINFKNLQLGNINNNNVPFKLISNVVIIDKNRPYKIDLNTNTQVQINADLTQLSLKNFNMFGSVMSDKAAIRKWDFTVNSDITFDTSKKSYTINKLTAKLNNIVSQGQIKGYYGTEKNDLVGDLFIHSFNLKNFLKSLGVQLTTSQEHALTKVQGKVNFDFDKDKITINLFDGLVDDSQFNGKVIFNKNNIKFTATINQLDTKQFLPIEIRQITPTDMSTAVIAQNNDKTAPTVEQTSSPTSAPIKGNVINPFTKWSHYNIDGQIKIGQLRLGKLQLQNVDSTVVSKNGIVTLETTEALIYQGDYHGKITADFQQYPPKYTIIENFSEMQIQPLLTDLIHTTMVSGIGQLMLALTTQGTDMSGIKQALDGHANFNIQNGTIKGINLVQLVKLAYGKFKRKPVDKTSENQETNFNNLTGTFTIENGIAFNDDLRLSSPEFNVSGKGTVNLMTEEINYAIEVAVKTDEFPQLQQFVEEAGGSIPFKVTGTLNKLKFEPNIPELIKRIAEKKLGKNFEDINMQFKDFNQQIDKASKELGKQLKSLFNN